MRWSAGRLVRPSRSGGCHWGEPPGREALAEVGEVLHPVAARQRLCRLDDEDVLRGDVKPPRETEQRSHLGLELEQTDRRQEAVGSPVELIALIPRRGVEQCGTDAVEAVRR